MADLLLRLTFGSKIISTEAGIQAGHRMDFRYKHSGMTITDRHYLEASIYEVGYIVNFLTPAFAI
ncbi:hypothetical protein IID10_21455 [candidate division KSB1 bacterium]|nr:hypothetical protein [candidate division KSB1 bacterium]TDI97145.1 MAG: hypothetical protein E2O76_10640 [Caldithrix sp.]